jgi:hypothetical protein
MEIKPLGDNAFSADKDKLEVEAMALEISDLAFISGFIHKKLNETDRYEAMLEKCINQRFDKIRDILKL